MTAQATTTGLQDTTAPASALQQMQWAIAGGTVDVITAAYPVPNTALVDGMVLAFRASGANTSTVPTFAPDGLVAYPITKQGGLPLAIGDIPRQLAEMMIRFNGLLKRWELINF